MTFEKLDELTKAIADYPQLSDHQNEDGFFNFDEELPQDLRSKLDALEEHLSGLFIDNRGQHSNTYFQAKKAGYKLVVVERDSFGPLGVRYIEKDHKFSVVYG